MFLRFFQKDWMYIKRKNKYKFDMRFTLIFALGYFGILSYSLPAFAIEISGIAPSFAGKTITLQAEINSITHERITLGNTPISEKGSFNLNFSCDMLSQDVHVFYIRCGHWEGVWYGKKNGKYEVEIPALGKDLPVKFDRSEMPVIWKSGTDSLHWLAIQFYQSMNRFIDEHYYDFAVEKFQGHEEQRVKLKNAKVDLVPQKPISRDSAHLIPFRHWVDQFADTVMHQYKEPFEREDFLQELKQFSVVKLQLIAAYPKTQIIQEHFSQENPPIEHPAYVDAANLCFDNFLNEGPKDFTQRTERYLQEAAVDSLLLLLQEKKLFSNASAPCSAILLFLMDQHGKQKITNALYQRWLDELSKKPSPIQKSAFYLLKHRNQCRRTWSCPEIQCVDHQYKSKKLSEYQGQLTYVLFFATWNPAAMKELQAMEGLANNFKQYVNFVAICMDDEMSGFLNYIHQHRKTKLSILYAGNHPEIREQFCMAALPHALLLSPKGLYINDYTKLPSEAVGVQIEKWLLQHGPANNNGTWKE